MTDVSPAQRDLVTLFCPPPHPSPRAPVLRLPEGSCDSHCHVFGPAARIPYAPDRTFTPPDAPVGQLRRMLVQNPVEFFGFPSVPGQA